jgi:acyl carrier protein
MTREAVSIQLQEIFKALFENSSIEINDNTTAKDIDEWDSINHIQLVVKIESNFKIKFTAKEIMSWNSVGNMIDSISSKL